jgi:hypothetical protein
MTLVSRAEAALGGLAAALRAPLASAAPRALALAEAHSAPLALAALALLGALLALRLLGWLARALRALREGAAVPRAPRVDLSLASALPRGAPRLAASPALALAARPGRVQCYAPATMLFLGEEPVTPPEGVRAAVARARAAQAVWARSSFAERRRVLRTIKAVVLAQRDDIVRLSCLDTGKTRVDAMLGEVLSSLGKIDWLIEHGEAALAPEPRPTNFTSAHKRARVEYVPLGVVGVIAPWN